MIDTDPFAAAFRLLISGDAELASIVTLSLQVSLSATVIAAVIALPLGAMLALARFPARQFIVVAGNALMGLPPVVAGLLIYLLLSRSGPLGASGLLFTPTGMVIAQTLLIVPIILSLTRQVVEDLWDEYEDHMRSIGASLWQAVWTLLWDGRFRLVTALLAGFGRASAEIGAVLIVGGNIAGYTRTITTAIALETARGDLVLALALGLILIGLTFLLNFAAYAIGRAARRWEG